MKTYRQTMLLASMLLALAACSPKSADSGSAAEPQADAGMVAEAVASAADAADATHPFCELVTFAEIKAAGAGNISKLDVIDLPEFGDIDCVYLDQGNYLGAGMSISFTTTEKLAKLVGSLSSTASEHFESWAGKGAAVTGLGERAAWVDFASTTLYVLKGDTVVQFTGTGLKTSEATVRAKVEALAQQVVTRMP